MMERKERKPQQQQINVCQLHNTTDTHYRHTLQTHTTTHSSSFLTQRTYSCSNFVVNISIGVRIIKEILGSVASGTPCIILGIFSNRILSATILVSK